MANFKNKFVLRKTTKHIAALALKTAEIYIGVHTDGHGYRDARVDIDEEKIYFSLLYIYTIGTIVQNPFYSMRSAY